MIKVSTHAYERARERLGLNADALKRLCALAYCYGTHFEDTKGALFRFLERRKAEHPDNDIRVYGENLFIFKGERLVTVYRLPNEVIPKPKRKRNEKI